MAVKPDKKNAQSCQLGEDDLRSTEEEYKPENTKKQTVRRIKDHKIINDLCARRKVDNSIGI